MECLQRPAVHPGWLSSFFKAFWSLLKLSLFKEPAERGESTFWVLGEKEEMRCKVANRCGRKSGTVPCLCSGCSCWLSCSLLRWFLLQKNHLPRHRESGNLLCLFFGRPRIFSFLTNLSCHWNLHSSCFSFIFLLLSWAYSVNTSSEFETRQFLFFQVLFIKFWCTNLLVMVTSLLLISGTFRFLTPSRSEDLPLLPFPPSFHLYKTLDLNLTISLLSLHSSTATCHFHYFSLLASHLLPSSLY